MTDEKNAKIATRSNMLFVISVCAFAAWYQSPYLLLFIPTEYTVFRKKSPETDFMSTWFSLACFVVALGTCTYGLAYLVIATDYVRTHPKHTIYVMLILFKLAAAAVFAPWLLLVPVLAFFIWIGQRTGAAVRIPFVLSLFILSMT